MVGDRAGPDGGAVAAGTATLLLLPLRSTADGRLHRVLAAAGIHGPDGVVRPPAWRPGLSHMRDNVLA